MVHGASKFMSRSERPRNFRLRTLLKAFCQFDSAGTRSANRMIDSPSLFHLRHPDIVIVIILTHLLIVNYVVPSGIGVVISIGVAISLMVTGFILHLAKPIAAPVSNYVAVAIF